MRALAGDTSPQRTFCHVKRGADEHLGAEPGFVQHLMDGDEGGSMMGVHRALLILGNCEGAIDSHVRLGLIRVEGERLRADSK